jgi:hypothetical protein
MSLTGTVGEVYGAVGFLSIKQLRCGKGGRDFCSLGHIAIADAKLLQPYDKSWLVRRSQQLPTQTLKHLPRLCGVLNIPMCFPAYICAHQEMAEHSCTTLPFQPVPNLDGSCIGYTPCSRGCIRRCFLAKMEKEDYKAMCSVCLEPTEQRGGQPLYSPGCCGCWLHLECAYAMVNSVLCSKTCPHCRATITLPHSARTLKMNSDLDFARTLERLRETTRRIAEIVRGETDILQPVNSVVLPVPSLHLGAPMDSPRVLPPPRVTPAVPRPRTSFQPSTLLSVPSIATISTPHPEPPSATLPVPASARSSPSAPAHLVAYLTARVNDVTAPQAVRTRTTPTVPEASDNIPSSYEQYTGSLNSYTDSGSYNRTNSIAATGAPSAVLPILAGPAAVLPRPTVHAAEHGNHNNPFSPPTRAHRYATEIAVPKPESESEFESESESVYDGESVLTRKEESDDFVHQDNLYHYDLSGAASVTATPTVSRTSLLGERDSGLYARRYRPTVEDPAAYGSTDDLTYYDHSARVTGAVSVSSTATVSRTSLLDERDPGLYTRRHWPTVEDPAAYGFTDDLTYHDRSVRVTGAASVSSAATVSRTSLLGERDPGLYPRRYRPTVEDPAAYGSTAELTYRDEMALQLSSGGSDELNGLTASYAKLCCENR